MTTNPTMVVKDGRTRGWADLERHFRSIAQVVDPLPVSVVVTTNEHTGMRDQAIDIAGWADNVNVKITIHGPGPYGKPGTGAHT